MNVGFYIPKRVPILTACLVGLGLAGGLAQTPKIVLPDTAVARSAPNSTNMVQAERERDFTDGMRYIMTDEPAKALPEFAKVLQKDPNNAAALFATAQAMVKLNRVGDALTYAKRAQQLDASNKFYTLLLAELYVKQKRYADAEALYETLLKAGVENAEYGIELAAIYLFDGKLDKALATYDWVEKILGPNEEISRQKQRIYLSQRKIDQAIGEAEKLAAMMPGDPAYLLQGAELLLANDRPDTAEKWINQALQYSTDLPEAHVLLAGIYKQRGKADLVKAELKKALDSPNLSPELKATVLTNYADLVGDAKGGQQEATELAQQMATNRPNDPQAQRVMANWLLKQDKKAEARNAFARAARLDGSEFDTWAALLQLDAELNQPDSLRLHSEQALEVFPTQGLFWFMNGSANVALKRYQQAVDALEESQKILSGTADAPTTNNINALLGDAYNGLNEYARSEQAYEAVLKADPSNEHVLNNYSYFLSLRKANLPRAAQMAQKLVEKYPNNATYLDTYAWVLYVSKEYAKAKQYIEKAISQGAASATVLEHYGDILAKLGQPQQAITQWKAAKAKGETNTSLDKKIATGKVDE